MTTPQDEPTPDVPETPSGPPATGWGEAPQGPVGYGPRAQDGRPQPRYGEYAEPGAPVHGGGSYGGAGEAPPPPGQSGQPQYGRPQYGQPAPGPQQYGQQQYGQQQYGNGSYPGAPMLPPSYLDTAAKPGVVPLRPLGLGEILDGAFGTVRANPRVMLGLPAVILAVVTVVSGVLAYLFSGLVAPYAQELEDLVGIPGYADALMTSLYPAVVQGWFQVLAAPLVTGVLVLAVGEAVIGRRSSTTDVLRGAWRRFGALLSFSLLQLLGTVVLWVGLPLLVVWAMVALFGAGGLLVLLPLVLGLVVLTVWIGVRLLLVPAALVLERQKLVPAVARGWRLSRTTFWRLLGIYLLSSVIAGVAAVALSVPFSVGTMLVPSGGASLVIDQVGGLVSSIVTSVFLGAVSCLLYIDVRMRREGLDVELAAAAHDKPAA